MIKNFNDLSNWKKIFIIILITMLLGIAGVLLGSLLNNNSNKIIINKDNLLNLIKAEYSVENIKESENEKTLEFAIKGSLEKTDLEELSKNLNEKNIKSGWGKEQIIVNIFNLESPTTEKKEFYMENLLNRIVIDSEKAEANISEYVNVPSVEKTDILVDYSKATIENNNGNLILSMDMDVSKNEDDLVDVVQQAKTFTIFFRESNKDKDIKSIELRLNPNDAQKKYNFHTEYENILEVIEVLSLQ